MRRLITLSFLAVLFLFSCKKDSLTANGNIVRETRTPGIFTGIKMSGVNTVHITYGANYQVELRGSSNLLNYYKTNIINGKLYLSYENANVRRDEDVEIFITLPILNSIKMSGSAKISINGNFPIIDFLSLDISGSGDIEIDDYIDAQELSISISGSGNVKGERINCKKADVTISGSGDVRIDVQQRLEVMISGSGNVFYTGNPVVNSRISGSGKVIKL